MCIFKHSGKSKDETIVKKTVMCSDVFRFNYYNFPAKFDEIFLVAVTERSIVPPLVLEEKTSYLWNKFPALCVQEIQELCRKR